MKKLRKFILALLSLITFISFIFISLNFISKNNTFIEKDKIINKEIMVDDNLNQDIEKQESKIISNVKYDLNGKITIEFKQLKFENYNDLSNFVNNLQIQIEGINKSNEQIMIVIPTLKNIRILLFDSLDNKITNKTQNIILAKLIIVNINNIKINNNFLDDFVKRIDSISIKTKAEQNWTKSN